MQKELSDLIEDIISWKQKYRNIFYVNIGNNLYIFRVLTRGEFFNILTFQEKGFAKIDDIILKMCLLYPEYNQNVLDSRSAGEIDYLIENIIKLSGFANEESLEKDIEKEREKISMLDNQIMLLICKAFPHLTPKDLDTMDYETLLKYLTLAEAVLDVKLDIQKPTDQAKIDFEQDNRKLTGKLVHPVKKRKPRGDVD